MKCIRFVKANGETQMLFPEGWRLRMYPGVSQPGKNVYQVGDTRSWYPEKLNLSDALRCCLSSPNHQEEHGIADPVPLAEPASPRQ